jgi:CDP-glucose 4,6-dehydratase
MEKRNNTGKDWDERSVLLTGANGFVGGWLAAALVDAGARVVVIVRNDLPHGGLRIHKIEERVESVRGDVLDQSLVERVLVDHEVSIVFHLAAQSLVGHANRMPAATFATNTMGTVALLEACKLANVGHVVLASSDKAYGATPHLPYKEGDPLLGGAPYETSKALAEGVARSYATTYGIRVATARCANIYGPGDLNFSRLIPDTIRAVLAGRSAQLRSDGTPRRDYLYASDAAQAYLALGSFCLNRMAPGTYEPDDAAHRRTGRPAGPRA